MQYVFITGMGRSGTKFLSELLKKCPNVSSQHEFIGNKEFSLLSWYLNSEDYAIPYLKRAKKLIDNQFSDHKVFIDVNGGLRNSVNELQFVFNNVQLFHLVRDPKKVTRSYFTRRNDEKNIHQIPKTKEDIEWWLEADKFSRICWNWNQTTNQLLNQNTTLIKLEKLTSDYQYLKDKLLDPVGIYLSKSDWEGKKSKKINRTRSRLYRYLYTKVRRKRYVSDRLPEFDNWPAEYKNALYDICGETMERLGYD